MRPLIGQALVQKKVVVDDLCIILLPFLVFITIAILFVKDVFSNCVFMA